MEPVFFFLSWIAGKNGSRLGSSAARYNFTHVIVLRRQHPCPERHYCTLPQQQDIVELNLQFSNLQGIVRFCGVVREHESPCCLAWPEFTEHEARRERHQPPTSLTCTVPYGLARFRRHSHSRSVMAGTAGPPPFATLDAKEVFRTEILGKVLKHPR